VDDVGGWATVVGIYTGFAGLAFTGWYAGVPRSTSTQVSRAIGHAATSVIAAMFIGTYSGLLSRSVWYRVPATAVAAAATANVVAGRSRAPGGAAGRARPVG